MSRKKNALTGFSADIIGQIISQILTFIAIPIYLNYLSDVEYGYWLTIGSVVIWISISDFGIGMALGRALMSVRAKLTNQKLDQEINFLINTSLLLFLGCSILFFLVGLFVYPFTVDWFGINLKGITSYKTTYFLCIIAGSLSMPLSVFAGVIESSQKLALNRNIVTLGNMLNILISIFLVHKLKVIEALGYSLLLAVIIKSFVAFFYASRLINLKISLNYFKKRHVKKLLKTGGYFQVTTIANTVSTNTDNLFISSFIGVNFVPTYNFTSKLFQIFSISIASKISQALFAGASEIIDKSQTIKLQILFNTLIKTLFRLALISTGFVYFFNKDFISLWVGESFYGGDKLNLIISYWVLYEFLARGSTFLIYAFNEFRDFAYISVLEIFCNVILSIILIQKYGLLGVAFATAISRTLTTGLYLFFYFKKKELYSIDLLNNLIKILFLSTPTFLFFFFSKTFFTNVDWIVLIFVGLISLLVNVLCFDLIKIIRYKHEGVKKILFRILNT